MPIKKEELKQVSWGWVESQNLENISALCMKKAYCILLSHCAQGKCKKHCPGNPNCLTGLGEAALTKKTKVTKDVDEPFIVFREPGVPAGLVNLGATCYANSWLQLWFHIKKFRDGVYQWTPVSENKSNTAIAQLQRLFASMQLSKQSYLNPRSFVDSLGLDDNYQQDANEFSQLFMTLLEDQFREQTNPALRNLVSGLFSGEYEYITTCKTCKTESRRLSKFSQLDVPVKDYKTLESSLERYLGEEKIAGDNKYYCDVCESKQDAGRHIELKSTPPVMCIQLLRFVYDRVAGKKKMNTFISFPEKLDMSQYTGENAIYDLVDILLHTGNSAESGHYIAQIQQEGTGTWYSFNDIVVEKLGRQIKKGLVEKDEDYDPGTPKTSSKRPPVEKGRHRSNNAYMLVYKRREAGESVNPQVPDKLKEEIEKQDQEYEQIELDRQKAVKATLQEEEEKRDRLLKLFQSLPCDASSDTFDFLPTSWLMQWLSKKKSPGKINTSSLRCSHGNLSLTALGKAKRINSKVADTLYSEYGGGPRITQASLCVTCVHKQATVLKLERSINQDEKSIPKELANAGDQGEYWAGRVSIRSWKKLARTAIQKDDEMRGNQSPDLDDEGNCDTDENCDKTLSGTMNGSLNSSEEPKKTFNSDLLCTHNQLTPILSCRRLVPSSVFERFKFYFPNMPVFKADDPICSICESEQMKANQDKVIYVKEAASQREVLYELFMERNRPKISCTDLEPVYVISRDFHELWKSFLRDAKKNRPVTSLGNDLLLCEHKKFSYRPVQNATEEHSFIYVRSGEWEILQSYIAVDVAIKVSATKTEDDAGITLHVDPAVCEECAKVLEVEKKQELLTYDRAKLYIKKLIDEEPGQPPSKRIKLSEEGETKMKRSRRTRGGGREKEIIVGSDENLKEVKVKIMKLFGVPPWDQHLWLDGKELIGAEKTLSELEVFPESTLELQVDVPGDEQVDVTSVDDYNPEIGFTGTNLVGR